mgnify:CR=1 FL=1
MSESSPVNPHESGIEVRTYFVRNRNALLARASLSELFVDYYLHLGEQKLKVALEHDALFKRALKRSLWQTGIITAKISSLNNSIRARDFMLYQPWFQLVLLSLEPLDAHPPGSGRPE